MTKRKAERRKALFNNHRILRCGTRPCGRARLSAFHHGTCGSDRTPPLSSSHATSWDSFGARAPMVRKTERIATHDAKPTAGLPCVTRGRYPRLAVPVQRDCTRSPVMMPSGRVLPKPPESATVTSRRPREPHSPRRTESPGRRPCKGARFGVCIYNGDDCQAISLACRDEPSVA